MVATQNSLKFGRAGYVLSWIFYLYAAISKVLFVASPVWWSSCDEHRLLMRVVVFAGILHLFSTFVLPPTFLNVLFDYFSSEPSIHQFASRRHVRFPPARGVYCQRRANTAITRRAHLHFPSYGTQTKAHDEIYRFRGLNSFGDTER